MKYVVVTGAAGGIGAATVALLREAGYGVIAADRGEHPGPALENLAGDSSTLHYIQTDVTDEDSVINLTQRIRALNVEVHGAVCCAGVVLAKPLLETTFEQWRAVQAVNSDGVFLTVRGIARLMVQQRQKDPHNERSIVVVSSNAAQVPRAEFGAYGASKAAASRVASSFGLQLAAHGIRVNTVSPGTTRTPMVTADWQGQDKSQIPVAGSPQTFRLGIPLGRIAEPQDIAETIAFLVSERARHLTMQEITVDGGATL